METIKLIYIGLIVLEAVLQIGTIGKDREPRTHGEAIVSLFLNAGLVFLLLN